MDEPTLSKEAFSWLGGWLSGGAEIKNLPIDVKNELINLDLFGTEYNIKLFRGSLKSDVFEIEGKDVYVVFDDFPSSWTYLNEMAENFSDFIISTEINSRDILIDTTGLDIRPFGGWPDEEEVILLPGRYLTNLSPDKVPLKKE
uniref:Uncharacterized protein n=1 Tax=Pithovirus LCPAC401 TaxID=2506595 RepID=A0A481Z953_9VIRU|nr:MAG: uncharacterized protein LCPAC401_00710 [Pithovirus LCPAC401]